MANIKKIFYGSHKSATTNHEIVVYNNTRNEIFIKIESPYGDVCICLDVSTAIQFDKELRKSIGYIKQSNNNE